MGKLHEGPYRSLYEWRRGEGKWEAAQFTTQSDPGSDEEYTLICDLLIRREDSRRAPK